MIELTDEEFETIESALTLATSGYEDEEIPELVAREAAAMEVVHRVRRRADPPA